MFKKALVIVSAALMAGFLALYYFSYPSSSVDKRQAQIRSAINKQIKTAEFARPVSAKETETALISVTQSPEALGLEQRFQAWHQSLADSHYPHDQLLAYHLARDKEQKALYLLQAYGLDPNDVMINLEILRFCREHQNPSLCDLPYMALLQAKEANNGYFHTELAAYAFADGDREEALKRLSEAATRGGGDFNEWRYLDMVDQSFRRFGIDRELQNVSAALGFLAAKPWPVYMRVIHKDMCSRKAFNNDERLREQCGAAARQLATVTADQTVLSVLFNIRSEAEGLDRQQTRVQWNAYADKKVIPHLQQTQELETQLANLLFQNAGLDMAAMAEQLARDFGVERKRVERYFRSKIYTGDFFLVIPDEVWAGYIQQLRTEGSAPAFNRVLEKLIEQQL